MTTVPKKNPTPIVTSNLLILSFDLSADVRKTYSYGHYSQSPLNCSALYIMFNKRTHLKPRRELVFTTLLAKEDHNNNNNQVQLKLIEKTAHFLSSMAVEVFHSTNLDTLLNYIAIHCSQLEILGISGLVKLSQQSNNNTKGEKIGTRSTVATLFLYDCIPTPGNFVCIQSISHHLRD